MYTVILKTLHLYELPVLLSTNLIFSELVFLENTSQHIISLFYLRFNPPNVLLNSIYLLLHPSSSHIVFQLQIIAKRKTLFFQCVPVVVLDSRGSLWQGLRLMRSLSRMDPLAFTFKISLVTCKECRELLTSGFLCCTGALAVASAWLASTMLSMFVSPSPLWWRGWGGSSSGKRLRRIAEAGDMDFPILMGGKSEESDS